MIIRENGREIVNNPLLLENGRYRMDVDHMREAVRGCRMFILCNPHNPGGRVWSPEELRRVAEICAESGTLVVSDEIHADLALPGHRHTVFATVSEQARMNSVTYMAPSKAFNVPGLGSSYLICQNPALFGKYQSFVSGRELAEGQSLPTKGSSAPTPARKGRNGSSRRWTTSRKTSATLTGNCAAACLKSRPCFRTPPTWFSWTAGN